MDNCLISDLFPKQRNVKYTYCILGPNKIVYVVPVTSEKKCGSKVLVGILLLPLVFFNIESMGATF